MQKIWFITGCSKGLGWHLIQQLLSTTDHLVVATARDPKGLENLYQQYPERLLLLPLDVTKPDMIDKAVAKTMAHWGRIDVLVNNAGYGLAGALEECSMEDIRALFETNVFGLIAATKAILPIMRIQRAGRIITISSVSGIVAQPGASTYNSTKFAIEGLSEALALELTSFGIHVTLIEPGPFRTDFAGGSLVLAPANSEYKDSPAYAIRGYMARAHGNQEGDPVRAAHSMIRIAAMDNPPLRMPLGNIAVDRIRAKLAQHQRELTAYESLSRAADFDMPPVAD